MKNTTLGIACIFSFSLSLVTLMIVATVPIQRITIDHFDLVHIENCPSKTETVYDEEDYDFEENLINYKRSEDPDYKMAAIVFGELDPLRGDLYTKCTETSNDPEVTESCFCGEGYVWCNEQNPYDLSCCRVDPPEPLL